jgi:hypothetical protein
MGINTIKPPEGFELDAIAPPEGFELDKPLPQSTSPFRLSLYSEPEDNRPLNYIADKLSPEQAGERAVKELDIAAKFDRSLDTVSLANNQYSMQGIDLDKIVQEAILAPKAKLTESEQVQFHLNYIERMEDSKRMSLIKWTRLSNVFGLFPYLSRKGVLQKIGIEEEAGDIKAASEAIDIYVSKMSLANPEKWSYMSADIGRTLLEFGVLPGKSDTIPKTALKFAEQAMLQLPSREMTWSQLAGQKAVEAGKAAAVGVGVGLAGKYIPNPLFRIPAVTGGFMALTALEGGTREQIIEAGITVLGFEAWNLALKGFSSKATEAAIKFNSELKNVRFAELEKTIKETVDAARFNAEEAAFAKTRPLIEKEGKYDFRAAEAKQREYLKSLGWGDKEIDKMTSVEREKILDTNAKPEVPDNIEDIIASMPKQVSQASQMPIPASTAAKTGGKTETAAQNTSKTVVDQTGASQGEKQPVKEVKAEVASKPETKISRLAKKTAERAIEKGIKEDFGDLPEYKTMDMAEQSRRARELVEINIEQARRIAQMKEEPPAGLRAGSVYKALENDALIRNDGKLSLELAKSPLAKQFSALGQEIKALDAGISHSPVKAIQSVAKTLEKAAQRRYKTRDLNIAREKITRRIDKSIRRTMKKSVSKRPTWSEFIKSIECN